MGIHSVEGVGIEFMPPLLGVERHDEARAIDEDEGRAMARRLAAEEGIFAGLNVAGATYVARELGPEHTVITVAADTGLKYFGGGLYAT